MKHSKENNIVMPLRHMIVKLFRTKRTIKTVFLCGLMFSLLIYACKKNQLGGKSIIQGKVLHHSKPIANASVFIKFKAKEFPGKDTAQYDAKVRSDSLGNYSLKCYKGDYYLYSYGHDYTILPPYIVVGGTPVHIRNNETVDIDVAVTEGD